MSFCQKEAPCPEGAAQTKSELRFKLESQIAAEGTRERMFFGVQANQTHQRSGRAINLPATASPARVNARNQSRALLRPLCLHGCWGTALLEFL